MERESIETKDTWNLSSIYKDEQEFYNDLNEAKQLLVSSTKRALFK